MSKFIFGVFSFGSMNHCDAITIATETAQREGVFLQCAEAMKNRQILMKMLSEQGELAPGDAVPFLIAEGSDSDVSGNLVELYGATEEEWQAQVQLVTENMRQIERWLLRLFGSGARRIVVYYADGYDTAFSKAAIDPTHFADTVMKSLLETRYGNFPSACYVMVSTRTAG